MTPNSQKVWVNTAVFGTFFLLFLHAIEDPDIWFHMTIGRAVFEQGAIPAQEFFVFTRLGEASEYHEWGFGLIYHIVHQLIGINGIILFNALLGALTVLIIFLTVRSRDLSVAISLCAALVGYWLLEFRFVQRPENFLYLSIVGTLYLLERFRQQSDWRFLIAIPVIGFLLAQIHPSVALLILVIGTYFVQAIAQKKPEKIQALQLGLVIILTLLFSLLNPYGLDQLILPIKFSLQDEFLQGFTEFLPALSTTHAYRFITALVIITFSLVGIRKKFSLAEWILLIAFSYLAYQHARNIALLGTVIALPFATALSKSIKSPRHAQIIAACIFAIVSFDAARFHRFKLDINPIYATVSGAETVAKYSKSSNILNFYHLGNYLAWRLGGTHKVIIDGRNFQDNKSLKLHDSLLSANTGWQYALFRYDIDSIVTPVTLPYSGDFIPLVFELIHDPQWALLNREPAGVVFIRRDRVSKNTQTLSERDLWLQAKSELLRNLEDYPDSESSKKSLNRVEEYLTKH
jgi:hypothetical protein